MKILLPPLIFPSYEVIKIPLQSHLHFILGWHHDFPPSVTSQLPFFRSVPIIFFHYALSTEQIGFFMFDEGGIGELFMLFK